ncbi:MAG: T9SS type B sorting domain-containing protein, partial [Psychroserpens sp.]|nr:T9SS type B sorting domain-containing protein [Psychroserpens sp.]
WITSNIFSGINDCNSHEISARESSGCSNEISQGFKVLNFPKFFTPNGDSYNNTWNIACLNNQASSVISIFDRYGKLLKQISPASSGWDGTYRGQVMPNSDYWFSVNFIDSDGQLSTFSSHFTLKR